MASQRDHASADELAHDIQQMRAPDQEALQDEILQACEDGKDGDWVCEAGRDRDAFDTDVARIAMASNEELDIEPDHDNGNAARIAMLRDLVRKEFNHYARRRAERETQ